MGTDLAVMAPLQRMHRRPPAVTQAQKRLRDLRERQSKERGRMAELSLVEEINDEQRAELDTIERGTPDLERQLRAAQVAVDAEQEGQRSAASPDEDAEARELRELRGKISMAGYAAAAVEQRAATGAEAEYNQARGIAPNRFPLDLLAPVEERATTVDRPPVRRHGRSVGGRHDGNSRARHGLVPRHHGWCQRSAAGPQRGRGRRRVDGWRDRDQADQERGAPRVQRGGRRSHPWPGERAYA